MRGCGWDVMERELGGDEMKREGGGKGRDAAGRVVHMGGKKCRMGRNKREERQRRDVKMGKRVRESAGKNKNKD